MDVLFTLIKSKDNINGTDLYDYSFQFTAYADNPTFFFKDITSVRILVDTFKVFSCFSRLKLNINKCGIACLGILKGAQEAICGLQSIDLTNDTIKTLEILIFKTLGISKIVYLSLIITVPNSILGKKIKIQETFLWYSSIPKINHKHSVIHLKMVKNVDQK